MKTFQPFRILFLGLFALLFIVASCNKDSDDDAIVETCSDGILNQDETGVDCGGSCNPCATCSDGIQNQDETGIDCGGACSPCFVFSEFMTATIDNVPFAANLVAGFDDGTTISFQSDQSQERQLFFEVPTNVSVDSFSLINNPGYTGEYKKLFQGEYINQSGHIVITYHDVAKKELGGRFELTGVEFEFGVPTDTVYVTNGEFGVEY